MKEGQTLLAGNALIRLRDDVRLIVLPSCSYCKKVAPECRCGHPRRDGK